MRYIIRTVPERVHWLAEITEQIPIPALEIVRDFERDAMVTFLRAMIEAGVNPAVHLEDDIELTGDFLAKIEAAIDRHPNQLIQFFSLRKTDPDLGSRWMAGRTYCMNQCFYLPAGYSEEIGQWYSYWPRRREHPTGSDLMIADWLARRGERYWLHVPSLVQHREGKSMIHPRRSSKRQSISFAP